MNKNEYCKNHEEYTIKYICCGQECTRRFLCQECLKSTSCSQQQKQHKIFSFNLKHQIKQIKEKYCYHMNKKLQKIMNIMKQKSDKQQNIVYSNIKKNIQSFSDTYFQNKWKQQLYPTYIKQIQMDNYHNLDLEQIRTLESKLKSQDQNLNTQNLLIKSNQIQVVTQLSSLGINIQIICKMFWNINEIELVKKSTFFHKKSQLSTKQLIQKLKKQIQEEKKQLKNNLSIVSQMINKNQVHFQKLKNEKTVNTIYPILEAYSWNNILKLSFKECKLRYLEIFNFKYLSFQNLKQLDLTSNQLSSMYGLIEFKMPSLRYLNLLNNNISMIDPLFKASWSKIEMLILSKNKITSLNGFQKILIFGNLKQIHFDGNKIQSLKPLCKIFLPNIRRISIKLPPNQKIEDLQFQHSLVKSKIWHYMM